MNIPSRISSPGAIARSAAPVWLATSSSASAQAAAICDSRSTGVIRRSSTAVVMRVSVPRSEPCGGEHGGVPRRGAPMQWTPFLLRSSGPGDQVRVSLGDPLVDDYLEFVAARCRPNTVLATAYDLKVFFAVV